VDYQKKIGRGSEMKGILFSKELIPLVLSGQKTMTRRLMKPQPVNLPDGTYCDPYNHDYKHFTFWTKDNKMILTAGGDKANMAHWTPRYLPGETVYLKENFRTAWGDNIMPEWASRCKLLIKDVRAERLQEITEEDAKMEGCEPSNSVSMKDGSDCYSIPFRTLWNSINGIDNPKAWDSNPWVWVYTFEVTR
jgi:hypothetical protein